jgi:hypothetical protein
MIASYASWIKRNAPSPDQVALFFEQSVEQHPDTPL